MQGLSHGLLAVVQSGPPGMLQEGQPQLSTAVLLQGRLDADEVLQALGHLAAIDGEVARVQEVRHPLVVPIASLQGAKCTGNHQ